MKEKEHHNYGCKLSAPVVSYTKHKRMPNREKKKELFLNVSKKRLFISTGETEDGKN